MKERNVAASVILAIVTLGVYTIYWLYATWKETHEELGRQHNAPVVFAFALIAWIVGLIAGLAYMALSFSQVINQAANGPNADPPLQTVIGLFVVIGIMVIAGLIGFALQLVMVWKATEGARMIVQRVGKEPLLPPLVHVLLPIAVNAWIFVVVGLIQHELNEAVPVAVPR